jgi:hypothetical protein
MRQQGLSLQLSGFARKWVVKKETMRAGVPRGVGDYLRKPPLLRNASTFA